MSRLKPWRSKPSPLVLDILQTVGDLRLYVVQELGPTSFVFKDDSQNKFKVVIGSKVSCSCNPAADDHCQHTLYALTRIFKRGGVDPLLWQMSYVDSEVEELISTRFKPGGGATQKKAFLKRRSESVEPKAEKASKDPKTNRISLNEEDVCSICFDNMQEMQGLTFCKTGCGHNFHLNCIKVWADHKQHTGEQITCPMCRTNWGPHACRQLAQEWHEFSNRKMMHQKSCAGCKKKPITGNIFHCLFCENTDLCQNCFTGLTHYEHDRYIMRKMVDAPWLPAPTREKMYLHNTDEVRMAVKNPFDEDAFNFMMPDFTAAYTNKVGKMAVTLSEHLMSCIPPFTAPTKENMLMVVGIDKMRPLCHGCNLEKDPMVMRRLFCSHPMCDDCLLKSIENKHNSCPKCLLSIWRGWVKPPLIHPPPGQTLLTDKLGPLPEISVSSTRSGALPPKGPSAAGKKTLKHTDSMRETGTKLRIGPGTPSRGAQTPPKPHTSEMIRSTKATEQRNFVIRKGNVGGKPGKQPALSKPRLEPLPRNINFEIIGSNFAPR